MTLYFVSSYEWGDYYFFCDSIPAALHLYNRVIEKKIEEFINSEDYDPEDGPPELTEPNSISFVAEEEYVGIQRK